MAELTAAKDAARLNVLRGGQVVVQLPELTDPAATGECSDLRALQYHA